MRRRRRSGGAFVAALILGMVLSPGCTAPDGPARTGAPAPELLATTLEGDTVALSSFRGRPVLLNLWATWCFPCRQESPYLQTLHERFVGEGLAVLGVTVDAPGATPAIREFIAEFGLDYAILRDPDMVVIRRFAVPGLPTTFLIDREGIVRRRISGPLNESDGGFEEALRDLLR